jgi:hypothetical protein
MLENPVYPSGTRSFLSLPLGSDGVMSSENPMAGDVQGVTPENQQERLRYV